ncbi:MAG: hypothetical protein Q9183_004642 [Haloplaca sp. 2 TL-2023]
MYYPGSPYHDDRIFGQDARRALQDRNQHPYWYGTHHHDRTLPAPTPNYGQQFAPLKYPERSYDPHTKNPDPYPADLDEDAPSTSTYHPKENSPEALQEQLYGITDFNALLRIWTDATHLMNAEKQPERRTEFRRVSERCEFKCRSIIHHTNNSDFVGVLESYCFMKDVPKESSRLLLERLKRPDVMRELLGNEKFMLLLRRKDTGNTMAFLLAMGYLHEAQIDEVVRREYG